MPLNMSCTLPAFPTVAKSAGFQVGNEQLQLSGQEAKGSKRLSFVLPHGTHTAQTLESPEKHTVKNPSQIIHQRPAHILQ